MIIFLYITGFLILLYLIYPFWVLLYSKNINVDEIDSNDIIQVSLIYLSQNGADFLENKISFLLNELSYFQQYELIVIDDNSTDKSLEILNKFNEQIKVILKNEHKGIPHSMNIGIKEAKFNHVVFCDQRQFLSKGIIKKLVRPFTNKEVGAVSACISQLDNKNNLSLLRAHENFIKSCEGKTGNLIGVYGPLYAVKKECYVEIPDYIILDDLYLTLKILQSHKVLLIKECQIKEEDADMLYDSNRIKRYIKGFLQLISEKELINQLSVTQIIMLFLHKYLRLIIPVLLFIAYISLGIMSVGNTMYLFAFILLTVSGIISIILNVLKLKLGMMIFIQVNLLYLVAISEIIFLGSFYKKLITQVTNYRNLIHRWI